MVRLSVVGRERDDRVSHGWLHLGRVRPEGAKGEAASSVYVKREWMASRGGGPAADSPTDGETGGLQFRGRHES